MYHALNLKPAPRTRMRHADTTHEGDKWPAAYRELSQLMYAVVRSCPRLPLLGTLAVNPMHPVPADHLRLIDRLIRNRKDALEVTGVSNEGVDSNSRRLGGVFKALRHQAVRFKWAGGCVWHLFLFAFRESLMIMFLRLKFRALIRQRRREPSTIVLTTSCPNPELLKRSDDFYYGDLPELLQKGGISYMRLCMDFSYQWESESAFVKDVLTRSRIRSMPAQLLVPVWAPLVTACNQLVTSFYLRRLAGKVTDEKIAYLYRYSSLDCLHPYTTKNTLLFYIARAAVKTWGAKVFVVLYEGTFDKLFFHGVKNANQECVTVGYQHAAIMPHSLQLLWPNNNSWELSTPDIVLCLGETTRKMIQAGHGAHKTKLIPFGAVRRNVSESGLRAPKPDRRAVLVVPQVRESRLLFNFAIRAASLLPDHRFIFRCHPNLPFARIRPHLEGAGEEIPNVEISHHESIAHDIARSSAVLYRASSAVLYAILQGLKPIYLHDDNHHDTDPLFELTCWRECVSEPREMEEILRRYEATTEDRATEEWRGAAEYVNAYMIPIDQLSINRFLAAAGLR